MDEVRSISRHTSDREKPRRQGRKSASIAAAAAQALEAQPHEALTALLAGAYRQAPADRLCSTTTGKPTALDGPASRPKKVGGQNRFAFLWDGPLQLADCARCVQQTRSLHEKQPKPPHSWLYTRASWAHDRISQRFSTRNTLKTEARSHLRLSRGHPSRPGCAQRATAGTLRCCSWSPGPPAAGGHLHQG